MRELSKRRVGLLSIRWSTSYGGVIHIGASVIALQSTLLGWPGSIGRGRSVTIGVDAGKFPLL